MPLKMPSVFSVVAMAAGMAARMRSRACTGHRRLHSAGHDPRRMHSLFGEAFDDLQTELAQLDAGARQLGIGLDHADDVADGRIGVHAEQQIGRGEIEEAERMRLHDLARSE